jgi:hypothetical protein
LWWGAVVIAAFLAGYATSLVIQWGTREETLPVVYDEAGKLASCQKNAINLTIPDKLDFRMLQLVADFCYEQIRREGNLSHSQILRSNYAEQRFEGRILLWMVVGITISGVALATIQLIAAYQLASAGRGDFTQGGEVTLERSNISLKTSVTGLLILTVSFAFFMVFVRWIYTEKDFATKSAIETDSTMPRLPDGGLGPPPGKPPAGPEPSNPVAVPKQPAEAPQ